MAYVNIIEDIAGMEFDELLLQQVHLRELDIVNSRINQRLDMSEELVSIFLVRADDVLSMLGMPWEVSRIKAVRTQAAGAAQAAPLFATNF